MIRELGETIGDAVVESIGRAVGRSQENRPLPADLLESEDAYLAVFDAAGVDASDVQVRFEDHTVHVRVDRFRDFREGYEMRFPGRGLSLEGSVELPAEASVDPDVSSATLKENGTLQVEIPKVEDDQADETVDADHEDVDDDTHQSVADDDQSEGSESDEADDGDEAGHTDEEAEEGDENSS